VSQNFPDSSHRGLSGGKKEEEKRWSLAEVEARWRGEAGRGERLV